MADTGWLNPSATGKIYNEWTNPSNAYTSDNNYASSESGSSHNEQDYYNFNISIPSGATINGCIVSIEGAPYSIKKPNFRVKLSPNGGSTWTATKSTGSYNSEMYIDLGGETDTWGRSWTIDELSNTNFLIHVENIGDSALSPYPCCDHIRIKWFYTEGSTVNISGSASASSSVSGATKVETKIAGSLSAISNVSGNLSIEGYISLFGSISVISSVTAKLNVLSEFTDYYFVTLNYILNGQVCQINFRDDDIDFVEIIPLIPNDIQRLQNNLPIVFKKPDAKQIILNLFSKNLDRIEALKAVDDIIILKIYHYDKLFHSFAVKLDRESCKTFGYFGGVPYDQNLQLIFYETESGYSALENQFNGVVY